MKDTALAFEVGLSAFTVQDLCHPTGLTEAVTTKLGLLCPGRFAHDRLEQGVRQILNVIRDAVCGEYRGLTLTALADFLQALDYFLRWADRVPDTWDGGYVDDLEEVVKVLTQHHALLADYENWLARRDKLGASPAVNRASPTPNRQGRVITRRLLLAEMEEVRRLEIPIRPTAARRRAAVRHASWGPSTGPWPS